jgi:hypothetical protein
MMYGEIDTHCSTSEAVERRARMALIIFGSVIVWFHETGHQSIRFCFGPW